VNNRGTFINDKEDVNNMTYTRKYECGSCKEVFDSKNKLKKHQKKQNPRHHGWVEKLMKDKTSNIQNTPKTTYKKSKGAISKKKESVAGNRSKKNPSQFKSRHKDSGVLEPTYDSGFFRISDEKLSIIGEILPDGCDIHTVPSTGHKIIGYQGDAYNAIDFLMYLNNFCELEMYYEDIKFCLQSIPSKQYIGIKDMNELGESVITFVDGDIIMTEFEEQSEEKTLTNEELLTSIADLSGVAVVFGKFKKDNTIKKKTTPIATKPKVETPTTTLDFNEGDYELNEAYNLLDKDFDPLTEEEDADEVSGDFMFYDRTRQDEADEIYGNDFMFGAEQFESQEVRGWGGGGSRYNSWNKKAYVPPNPVAEKYHPIYGIRGHKLLVDRIVDLTSIIENNEEVQEAETFEAPIAVPPMQERETLSRMNQARAIRNQDKNDDRLNVAITDVDTAYEWSLKQFEMAGLTMTDYIPHFQENYLSLQEECRLAIDIPRIDMPVIDPDELGDFKLKLQRGELDVFTPFAIGDELYSPEDLIKDTPDAIKFLQLGYEDGLIPDDMVDAKITKTAVGLMRPTQSQIWLDKLIGNIIQWGKPSPQGAYDKDSKILTATIAISQEGYILDGHHRYGQVALVNPTLKMQTLYIGVPIRILVDIGRPYGNAIGNEQRAAEESTETN
jgi:hypothetical protein